MTPGRSSSTSPSTNSTELVDGDVEDDRERLLSRPCTFPAPESRDEKDHCAVRGSLCDGGGAVRGSKCDHDSAAGVVNHDSVENGGKIFILSPDEHYYGESAGRGSRGPSCVARGSSPAKLGGSSPGGGGGSFYRSSSSLSGSRGGLVGTKTYSYNSEIVEEESPRLVDVYSPQDKYSSFRGMLGLGAKKSSRAKQSWSFTGSFSSYGEVGKIIYQRGRDVFQKKDCSVIKDCVARFVPHVGNDTQHFYVCSTLCVWTKCCIAASVY